MQIIDRLKMELSNQQYMEKVLFVLRYRKDRAICQNGI